MPRQIENLKYLFAYAWRYKVLLAVTLVMGVLGFAVTFVLPWLIGSAIDRVIAPPVGVNEQARYHWLLILMAIGAGVVLTSVVAGYGRGPFTVKLGNRIIADLRQDLFDHLNRLSLHFYTKERTGSIVSRLINDIQQASQIMNAGVMLLVLDVLQMLIGVGLMLSVSWRVTAACVAVLPLYALTFRIFNPRVQRASDRVQSQISKMSGTVQERLAGIALVKAAAAEDRERERFRVDNEEFFGRVVEQSSVSHLVGAISEGLVHVGTMVVIGLGGYIAIFGRPPLSAGDVVKLLGWLGIMYGPVRRFAEINIIFQTSMAAVARVFQVFAITPKIRERRQAVKEPPRNGEVRFENVYFRYSDDSEESRTNLEDEPRPVSAPQNGNGNGHDHGSGNGNGSARGRSDGWVLNDLSFTVSAGSRVALVGPSGSGKTTIVSLLPRLYDVGQGRILIDGVDVRDYRLKPLRQAIAIVQQQSLVFSGSVRENLCYGSAEGTSAEQMVAASCAANAHEFVERLPDGYDTLLGERGANLSGGQLQRLSIARALLRNPKILILDEATSALDADSEELVQQALDRVMRNRTCFIIAHRLSTVRSADRILVMKEGRIVESGTHDELLAHDEGLYAHLVRKQFGAQATGATPIMPRREIPY
ncbi:MAG: msbA [Phycisphaerales bacterium]|nr:msbA [Phycisphaerales bacterium]